MPFAVLNRIEDTVLRLTGEENCSLMDCCKATPLKSEESEMPLMKADCKEKFSEDVLSPGGLFFLSQRTKNIVSRNKSLHIMVG